MKRFVVLVPTVAVVELFAASAIEASDMAQEELARCVEAAGQELLNTSPEQVVGVSFRPGGDVVVQWNSAPLKPAMAGAPSLVPARSDAARRERRQRFLRGRSM